MTTLSLWPASETPARCAATGHPGVIHKGRPDTVDQPVACCGGPGDRHKEGD